MEDIIVFQFNYNFIEFNNFFILNNERIKNLNKINLKIFTISLYKNIHFYIKNFNFIYN